MASTRRSVGGTIHSAPTNSKEILDQDPLQVCP